MSPDLLLIYGPGRFTHARGVHGKGWAGAGTVRLCDADELDAREARTFARTLLPYPRTLAPRICPLLHFVCSAVVIAGAGAGAAGETLLFHGLVIFFLLSFLAFLCWCHSALLIEGLLRCCFCCFTLFSMRCDAMQCYGLLFAFVFCRDL